MFQMLRSDSGGSKIRGILILLIVIVGIFFLIQYVRTKIKIEDMRGTVKEQATGAKIRESWNDIIIENLLTKAEELGIITVEDIQNETWPDKIQIEINRPLQDRIELKVSFQMVIDFIIFKKVSNVLLEEKAQIYDM